MKTLLVPGWMKSVAYYGEFNGLDIWKNDFILTDNRSVECVVAHSMGAAYALVEDNIGNEKTKYYLINPLLVKRNFLIWFWRWIKCALNRDVKFDPRMSFKNIFLAAKKALKISQLNIENVLEKIAKENVVIIRGVNDNYFCDNNTIEFAKKYGFEVIEVDDMGHEWNEKYKDIIDRIMR